MGVSRDALQFNRLIRFQRLINPTLSLSICLPPSLSPPLTLPLLKVEIPGALFPR